MNTRIQELEHILLAKSNTENEKLWHLIEAYRTSGGSEEHYAQKELLQQALTEREPVGYVKAINTPFGKKLQPVLTKIVPVNTKLYAANS